VAIATFATLAFAPLAHAEEPWRPDRARDKEFAVTAVFTREATAPGDALGMVGGRIAAELRVSPRWSFGFGLGGAGGREAEGFLVGSISYPIAPDVRFYLAPRAAWQPYILLGYELSIRFLRGGSGMPKQAGGAFLYSGPSGGVGVDARVGRSWFLRIETRAFAFIRGFPDSQLQDAPALADATRWLTGVSVATGIGRAFDL
jgi:hypothetical protein